MESEFCANCGKHIPPDVLARRHYSAKKWPAVLCCNYDCAIEYRKKSGQYKDMSAAGHDKRVEAVAKSNHSNPRRKKGHD